MAVSHETELYKPIKAYFEAQGYEVKSEIMHCDLVAIHPQSGATILVEMKKTFNLALLLQGIERLRLGGDVILAIERNRKKNGAHNQRFGDLTELCRMLGIGLMTVTFFKTKAPVLDILCEPGDPPVRGQRRLRQTRLLNEFRERSGDYNTGGSTGRKLMTAFREKALRVAWALHEHGQLPPRKAAELTQVVKASHILQKDYYGWFERVERGVYRLKPDGTAAVIEHRKIIEVWLKGKEPQPTHNREDVNE
ncbi:hypothetical protein Back11_29330 [Paenibacillus baekrokdamisoli]|uniref:Uncharacterized protein n=1 Tax=Paenibacillus baekrokdamisoli TaxID=1712516 RepID=A0A3G9JCD8_9BACL|nr:DUF2161 family putative PD-(D/E)XK-type phosphodiesterase [Paenibacillus baekrokdamisoli]MBB3071169.1 hypothetical protein [Paenibacillus baekrokdamisoli]BBH21588.1 hypothetical protein Back11_29330 [Paenibacillus baekrokdamisoli]